VFSGAPMFIQASIVSQAWRSAGAASAIRSSGASSAQITSNGTSSIPASPRRTSGYAPRCAISRTTCWTSGRANHDELIQTCQPGCTSSERPTSSFA